MGDFGKMDTETNTAPSEVQAFKEKLARQKAQMEAMKARFGAMQPDAEVAAASSPSEQTAEPSYQEMVGKLWLQEGNKAYDVGDYNKAVACFETAAESGNAEAAVRLAKMYGNGDGVTKDPKKTIAWLKYAADLGDADAMVIISALLASNDPEHALMWAKRAKESGRLANTESVDAFISQLSDDLAKKALKDGNTAEGVRLLKEAAESGNAAAAAFLGTMYLSGNMIPQDDAEGFRWMLRAAERGDTRAMAAVAAAYYSGEHGADEDLGKAYFWGKKAVASSELNENGREMLGELISNFE